MGTLVVSLSWRCLQEVQGCESAVQLSHTSANTGTAATGRLHLRNVFSGDICHVSFDRPNHAFDI